ncbi:MAG: GAF domain-containing protein [Thermoleophilia bacterium]|nr:GAF domain-containing protein [Thermoleophilia bacterium]
MFAYEVTESITRSRTQEAALRVSVSAMSSLDFDETIMVVMDGLTSITGVDTAALFLVEDDQWVGKAGHGEISTGLVQKLRFPYEAIAPARESVERKEVITIDDAGSDGGLDAEYARKLKVRSAMVVPLVSGSRAIGAVVLYPTGEKRLFDEDQIKFATIIGSHAALAIENSIIYQNELAIRKSLEAIELVSEAGLVSLDLEEVLFELVNRTQDVMQMDAAMFLLYDARENCLVGRAATGASDKVPISQIKLAPGEGIAGRAFQEGAPMKIDDIRGHESEMCAEMCPLADCHTGDCPFSEQHGIVSVLAVPLRVTGRLIGVLQIGSRRQAAFSAREWGLIQVLADRASLAVQNSMLHEETARELARVKLLRELADACAGSQHKDAIAERALQAVYERMDCSIASIYWLDPERDELVNLAFRGHPPGVAENLRIIGLDRSELLLIRAVNERRIITHEDFNVDNASEQEAGILRQMDIGYSRCARVPIVYQNEPVGAMAVVFRDSRAFTSGELETLKSISHLLAVAFKNSSVDRESPLLES